ncbi:MAG: hypothetical protein P8Y91_06725, partial [Desulfuromonadales bacterium]
MKVMTVTAQQRQPVAAETAQDETEHAGPETDGYPGEQNAEQGAQPLFHGVAPMIGQYGDHEIGNGLA